MIETTLEIPVAGQETREKKLPRGIHEREGLLYIRFTDGAGRRRFERVSTVSMGLKLLTVRKAEVLGGGLCAKAEDGDRGGAAGPRRTAQARIASA